MGEAESALTGAPPFIVRRSRKVHLACMHTPYAMASTDTSLRISRETLRALEQLRATFGTQSADETIRKLLRERRSRALSWMFGSGRGRISPFTEADHLESHDR